MRAYLLVIVLLLAVFGAIGGYLYDRFSTLAGMDFSLPPVTIAAAVAQPETWRAQLQAVGTLAAVRGVELTSEESGEVTAIHFDSGDQVEQGALLVTLNDQVEQASQERQQANLDLARILYQRDRKLVKQKSIPQSQLDRSRADFESAQAQLDETRARLRNKRIHAPFAGTMGIRQIKVGDYVQPGTVIAALQDLSELEVDFTLPARHFPGLRPGLTLDLSVTAYPGQTFKARLQAVDARVDTSTGNLLLRATLLDNSGLLPGMFARLQLDLDDPVQVVTVPETAVTYSLHGNTVFVIDAAEDALRVQPRIVQTGTTRDGRIAILTGLAAGERVASAGQNKLFRGAQVVIDESVLLE